MASLECSPESRVGQISLFLAHTLPHVLIHHFVLTRFALQCPLPRTNDGLRKVEANMGFKSSLEAEARLVQKKCTKPRELVSGPRLAEKTNCLSNQQSFIAWTRYSR